MERNDRYERGNGGSIETELPDTWSEAAPDRTEGRIGSCETGQGTMLYDREVPGSYIIGSAVDLSEMA